MLNWCRLQPTVESDLRHSCLRQKPLTGVGEGLASGLGEGLAGCGDGLAGAGEGLAGVGEGLAGVGEGLAGVGEGLAGVGDGLAGVGEGLGLAGVGEGEDLGRGLQHPSRHMVLPGQTLPHLQQPSCAHRES
mgnify:CR=1 FL=1